MLGILNKAKNVAFMNSELTSEIAYNIPCYDLISFLNVFHHIVHFKGFSEAEKIMKCLYKKTKKTLLVLFKKQLKMCSLKNVAWQFMTILK